MSSRRAFLRSAAACVALPFLPSLAGRGARADDVPPVRLVFWYCPNGMHMPSWTPATAGTGWELTPILTPLADLRDDVTVITGLANRVCIDRDIGDHPRGTAAFSSCAHVLQHQVYAGISADQAAAAAIGASTPFRSLQLGLPDHVTTCDPGYACVYATTISWAGPSTPLPPTTHPRVLFDQLFRGTDATATAADRERRRAVKTSILDHVHRQTDALGPRLAAEDVARLDEYLTAVRELEGRLDASTQRTCEAPASPAEGLDIEDTAEAMADLMTIALRCDLTRVISFMSGVGGSAREMSFLGINAQHHSISHHMGLQENFDRLEIINTWEVEVYAAFLRKLRGVVDGSGTLLDHTLVVLGSEISDGNLHTHVDLPVLLGGGRDVLDPGRHLVFDEAPVADLYVAMLQAAGVPVARFGVDGTAPLAGLLRT